MRRLTIREAARSERIQEIQQEIRKQIKMLERFSDQEQACRTLRCGISESQLALLKWLFASMGIDEL